jgi:exonuclease SbcD
MRLLHTSDWHLGRRLHRVDLLGAQAAFVDHLVEVVRAERIDAVLICGDIYDRALPPVDAVGLWSDALARLRAAGSRVVVISGNHDSARRLGCGSEVLDSAEVHIRTRAKAVAEPVVLEDSHGAVLLYPIPYLEPAAVDGELPGPLGERSHAGVLRRAVGAVRADLAGRAPARSVVLAHAWVAGGAPGDSERDIAVGGVSAVPTEVFNGFDYVALGHLHRPQALAPHLRYSGSPLPYSFSEAGQQKISWLVELGAAGSVRVEPVPTPVHRRLSQLRGTLEELLIDPAHRSVETDFLAAVLTDPVRPEAAMDRLRVRFPHALLVSWEPPSARPQGVGYRELVAGRSDLELALEFVSRVRGSGADPAETSLLQQAFEAARSGEDQRNGDQRGSALSALPATAAGAA